MISPERAAYLRRKYIDLPSTPKSAAITAEAEQIERMMRDLRQACEEYNGPELAWLLWELPRELRERIDGVQVRLREAQSRDGRRDDDGPRIVFYDDNRNKHDEANGWPAYDPDNPAHQTVPLGVVVSERDTVHVLRGGTGERVVHAAPKGHQSFADEARAVGLTDMPDFGPAYDFQAFVERADYRRIFRHCDLAMPKGCKTGIGGGETRCIAVPTGRMVFVLTLCASCISALAKSHSRDHKNWRAPEWVFGGDRESDRWVWASRRYEYTPCGGDGDAEDRAADESPCAGTTSIFLNTIQYSAPEPFCQPARSLWEYGRNRLPTMLGGNGYDKAG